MTQRERDRLVVLKKAQKKHITQRQAAEELKISERQVRRLLGKLKEVGDRAVVHGLRGRRSNRRLEEKLREKAVQILSEEVYRGFGPTLASEYLASKHKLRIGREALRQLMLQAGLWRQRPASQVEMHQWRARRSSRGELVQWDTSEHDWLEGRGEKLYLIHMIDDATSELTARFVRHDSTEENMRMVWHYLERHGRPEEFYTDKASIFQTAPQKNHPYREESPPTQIGRALMELGIGWVAAHSPQAKGRIERSFLTAQDRLVKGLRVAGVRTLEAANEYLEQHFMPWWNQHLVVRAAIASDAHRPLDAFSRSSGLTEPGGSAADRQRSHVPFSEPALSDRRRACASWITGSCTAGRNEIGWLDRGTIPEAVSSFPGVPAATESSGTFACAGPPPQSAAGAEPRLATRSGWNRPSAWDASVESSRDRSDSHHRRVGISCGQQRKQERRAIAARRSSPLLAQGLGSKTSPPGRGHVKIKNPRTGRSRVLIAPIRNRASPVASALGIRLGATPHGRAHPNMPFSARTSKPDISTWHRIGHFYLALTAGRTSVVKPR